MKHHRTRFQSRNRDTFLFKLAGYEASLDDRFNLVIEILFFSSYAELLGKSRCCASFNLVIEILFFSSIPNLKFLRQLEYFWFQSRNRDTFLFKKSVPNAPSTQRARFNLVIEILFFSRQENLPESAPAVCFNLVIEILFFSSSELCFRCTLNYKVSIS